MAYMLTFTINIPPMLAYIPYMDPMGKGWKGMGNLWEMYGEIWEIYGKSMGNGWEIYGKSMGKGWKLGIMVSKGNHPQMALIQVSELL